MQPGEFPYCPSTWRARSARIVAIVGGVLSTAALLVLVALAARDALSIGEQPAGTLGGWVVALGLAVLILWQAMLALCNALVVTAALTLDTDTLVIHVLKRHAVRVPQADIIAGGAFEVLYRLGRAGRIKAPIIRPRRRYATAVFVPLRRVSAGRALFWGVARMYAGRLARYGFLITPDHAQNKDLLARLQQVSDPA